MSDLFNIRHEGGDLSEYDSTVTDGGDLSVEQAAALGGCDSSYGLQCVIDDSTGIYGQKTQSAPGSNEIRFRFYVDPNGLTMADADTFQVVVLGSTGPVVVVVRAALRYTVAGGYHVRIQNYEDGGGSTHDEAITDAEHYIEIHVQRASSDVASDGQADAWVDGSLVKTWANIDNYDVFGNMNHFRMGAVQGIDAGTSGTLYIDELKANDDGGEIGACPQTISVDALTLVGSVQDLTLSLGAVALGMNTLTLAGSAETLTWTGVYMAAMDALTLAGSVQSLTVVPGAIAKAMDALTLASGAQGLTVIPGTATILASAITLSSSAQGLTVVPGAITKVMDALTLAGSVGALTWTGSYTVAMDALTLAIVTVALTAYVSPRHYDVAIGSAAVTDLDVSSGAVTLVDLVAEAVTALLVDSKTRD